MMLWIFAAVMLGMGFAQTTGWTQHTLEHDGLPRTYTLYVPETLLSPAPLLIALHPAGTSGVSMAQISQFDQLAARAGWIVAYPDGPGGYWDYGAGTPEWARIPDVRDDPGFLAALIEEVAASHEIDRARIYAAGFSNGGRMAFRMACDLPLAAVAVVAATVSDEVTNACPETGRVALWMQHGTADTVVPFEGKPDLMLGSMRISRALGVIETAQFYALRNGCDNPVFETLAERTSSARIGLTRVQYQDCAGDASVEVIVADGGGHTWAHLPGIETATLIWTFFEKHTYAPPEPEAAEEE